MSQIDIRGLTIRFPVYGADNRSLKRQITRAVGGTLGKSGAASAPLVTALHNVSLQMKPGDRLGLVGHNGAGKTTLLRTIAGAYHPDEGVVLVEGKVASLFELGVGMDYFATGLENIRLKGLAMGMTSKQMKARTEEIVEFSGLGPFIGLPLKTYSSGMLARLAFAVVTMVDADIVLMDEWIGVGDADFRQKAHDRLMDLIEQSKIFVFASHDIGMMRLMCNKFMGLSGGKSTGVMSIDELDNFLASAA